MTPIQCFRCGAALVFSKQLSVGFCSDVCKDLAARTGRPEPEPTRAERKARGITARLIERFLVDRYGIYMDEEPEDTFERQVRDVLKVMEERMREEGRG